MIYNLEKFILYVFRFVGNIYIWIVYIIYIMFLWDLNMSYNM